VESPVTAIIAAIIATRTWGFIKKILLGKISSRIIHGPPHNPFLTLITGCDLL